MYLHERVRKSKDLYLNYWRFLCHFTSTNGIIAGQCKPQHPYSYCTLDAIYNGCMYFFSLITESIAIKFLQGNYKQKTNVSLALAVTYTKLQINMQVINIFIRKMTYAC